MDLKHAYETITKNESLIEEVKREKVVLDLRIRNLEAENKKLRSQIITYMQGSGVKRETLDYEIAAVHIHLNPGKVSLDVPDVEALPLAYVRLKKEPDKKKIQEFIDANAQIPNWCNLKKGEDYLTFKASV